MPHIEGNQLPALKILRCPTNLRPKVVEAALSRGKQIRFAGQDKFDRMAVCGGGNDVRHALKRLKMVLFPWMVVLFQADPTKTKAICIFDMFLAESESNLPQLARLREEMQTVRQNAKLAKSMSWLKRVATSSGRKVDPNIFDDMLVEHMTASSRNEIGQMMRGEEFNMILNTPSAMIESPELKTQVEEIIENCKNAGFSLKLLGLSDLFS